MSTLKLSFFFVKDFSVCTFVSLESFVLVSLTSRGLGLLNADELNDESIDGIDAYDPVDESVSLEVNNSKRLLSSDVRTNERPVFNPQLC